MRLLGCLVALLLLARPCGAEEFRKWTDSEGRVHFSNRGDDSSESPPAPGSGWESVIERKEGVDEFSHRAESTLNALAADRARKEREVARSVEKVRVTQAEIAELQRGVPQLIAQPLAQARAREQAEIAALQKLQLELARIDADIAKVKAVKAMGREQAEKLGQSPELQH